MLVQTREDFNRARTVLLDADVIAIDTETTKTPVYADRRMIGVATYCHIKGREPHAIGFYFPFRHNHSDTLFSSVHNLPEEWIQDLLPVVEREDVVWTLFNFAFDKAILDQEGLRISDKARVDDPMLQIHLVNENHFNYELDNLARIYLNKQKVDLGKLEESLGGWDKIPPDVMGHYAEVDCELTFELRSLVLPMLEEQELTQLWIGEGQHYSRTLSQVVKQGILVDRKQCESLSRSALQRMQEIRDSLGFDPSKKALVAHSLFGLPSAGGLGLTPSELTSKSKNAEFPQGLPSTAAEDLQLISLHHPEARDIVDMVLEFRSLQKAESTWYSGFLTFMGEDDLLHPGLKQHGTRTGRLSSFKPNLQQIPRDIEKTPVKKLFLAPPGYELWEYDYSQLELRLACVYAGQENMKEAYRQGTDVHHITAEFVGALSNPDLTYDQARYVGKTSNFLLIYLGGPDTLQATLWREGHLIVPLDDCQQYHTGFHELYPNFKKTAYLAMQTCEHRGYIKYWNGRRRHLKFRDEVSKAFNSLIQGGCGQIVMNTMLMIDADPEITSPMINQVHDSIWFYIKKSESEAQRKLIQDVMEWPSKDFEIPFPVEGKLLHDGGE